MSLFTLVARQLRARTHQWGSVIAALVALLGATPVVAGPFEIAISPSRFEVSGKSATRVGQSLDIYNVGSTSTEVSVRTIDWTYAVDGNIGYHDELLPGSCRPWVTLERKAIRVAPRSKVAFRFQIDVPADAPRGECRFMLAVEGVEPAQQALIQSGGASLSLPVNGRIAVAVYVAVNGAESKLELTQLGMKDINGKRTPVVTVSNSGDAHGRLDGSLDAIDAKGQEFELVPEETPIMPGQTRTLPLLAKSSEPDQKPPEAVLPIKSKGRLDWEKGSFKLNAEFK